MTIALTDKLQFQAWAIQQERYQPAQVHHELMDWITQQYGVQALDFSCETRTNSKGTQQLVHVVLTTAEEVKRMQSNRAEHNRIADRFLQYFRSSASDHAVIDPLKRTVLSFVAEPFPEVIVTYRPLQELNRSLISGMLNEDERVVLRTFESVWTLSQSVIFFYTIAQIKENQENGTSAKIIAALTDVYRKYGFESPKYTFDSKEVFDRHYESNWYYYWK